MPQFHPALTFPATHWTCILAAHEAETDEGRVALGELCRAYWLPIYGLIRRQGHSASDAADLTQDYFTRLIQGRLLRAADRQKGRFRALLRADCRFFLADERDRRLSKKRGGDGTWLSLDVEGAEEKLGLGVSEDPDPDLQFDRSWALAILDRAFDLLASGEAEAGRGESFEQLKGLLTRGSGTPSYATIAGDVGTTAIAVQSAIARLRRRYRAILRAVVASTLASPSKAEIDEEIRVLCAALAR